MRGQLVWFSLLLACNAYAGQSVTTQHNDNQRTGANTAETILTPANVNSASFGRIFTRTLDARVNGQVLYMPNVNIAGGLHNVIYCTTSTNADGGASSLYAFDADDPTQSAPLFRIQMVNAAQWTTGAPVIDPANNIIFVLNKETNNTGPTKLHAFDITNGAEKLGSPITLAATVPGTGDGSAGGTLAFNSAQHNCRAALLFANGSVYSAFSHNTDQNAYHGWVFKYSYVNGTGFVQDKVFCTTPNAGLGGIWQTGKGLMADASGNIYFTVGNGIFNMSTNPPSYGMCIMKLDPNLTVLDWFAPSNQLNFSNADADTGNTGVLMIPGVNRLVSGGTKYGRFHLLDSNNLGHTGWTPSATATTPDTCLQTISTSVSNDIRQNPVAWSGGASSTFVYLWGNGQRPTAYAYTAPGSLAVSSTNANYTANGGALCVTSNGTSNGILWALENNSSAGNNVFHAFSATNLSTELWNSSQAAASRDSFGGTISKWQFPIVVNGKAYIPNGSNQIVVYSLFGSSPTITSVSPSTGLTTGGTTITVTGSNFVAGTSVKIGNNACTNVVVNSPTSLTAVTPAGAAGTVNVSVTNNALTNPTATLANAFTYSDNFRAADNPPGAVAGAFFRYYNVPGATLPIFSLYTPFRTGAKVNGTILPENAVTYPITQNDNFSMQITGYLNIPSDGTWTLYTASDGGSRLYIGSQLAVDNNFAQTIQTRKSIPIKLRQGLHAFTLQFAQSVGGFGCYVGWGSPDATVPIALDPDPFTGGTHAGPPPAANRIPDSAFFYVPPSWTTNGGGNWSNPASWNTDAGLGTFSPFGSDTTYEIHQSLVLRFPTLGGFTYLSNNDLPGATPLYVMELSSTVDGNTIQGNPLNFAGALAFPYKGLTGPAMLQTASGSATISAPIVARDTLTLDGSGTGIVTLSGALSNVVNGGKPTGLIKNGSSQFVIAGDAGAFAAGPVTVNAGTLTVTGSLPNANTTIVHAGATLRGEGNGTTTGVIAAVALAGGTIWPGTTATTLQDKGTLTAASADFSSTGSLKIRLSTTAADTVPVADRLVLTAAASPLNTGSTAALSLSITAQNGTYNDRTVEIVRTAAGNLITAPFFAFNIVNASGPSTGITLLYVNDTYTGSGATGIVATQAPGAAATPANFAANRIFVRLNSNVTPVTFDIFSAKAEGAGVALEWNTVSEFQNVGFNVYRRYLVSPVVPSVSSVPSVVKGNETTGWSRVNETLIPGRLTNAEAKAYRLYDWAPVGVFEYRLESVSLRGAVEAYAQLSAPVTVEGCSYCVAQVSMEGIAPAMASCSSQVSSDERTKAAREGTNQPNLLVGHAMVLPADAPYARANAVFSTMSRAIEGGRATVLGSAQSPSAAARWFTARPARGASFVAAKVVYSTPGVLAIPQSALPAGFDIRRVAVRREGVELPALAVSGGKLLLFAPGYQDDYTDKDALFLRAIPGSTQAGAVTRATGLFNSTAEVNTDTIAMADTEYHDVYFDYSLRPYNYPPWFSSQYLTAGSTQSFSLTTPGVSSAAAFLSITLWSLTDSPHALQLKVNGQAVGQAQWDGGNKMMVFMFQLNSVLKSGANSIELITPAGDSASQISFLHSLSVAYTKSLDGSAPLTVLNMGSVDKLCEVSNLPSADAWVVDARFPARAALVPYETVAQPDGRFKLRFTARGGGSGQYRVVPAGMENTPISAARRVVAPLRAGAPYLAVGPQKFATGVQPLLLQHQKEGLRGTFADQEQLFDYYGYGRYGPSAIQAAVCATRPKYVLLVGRTNSDYRNYSGANVDPLCPAFLVSTAFWSQATSDSRFGDLGRGFTEVAVGRLPVNDANELGVAVKRILAHKPWLASGAKAHVAADRADLAAGDFSAQADTLAADHPEFTWQRNYLGVNSQTSGEVTDALCTAAGSAQVLMYIGHGNSVRLGAEAPRILDTTSVQTWTGNTIFLQATCTAHWMAKDEAGFRSIAMQALTQPQGGISASVGTSTYMDSESAVAFMSRLLQSTASGRRWGDALLSAQQWAFLKGQSGSLFFNDLSATEQLFGDPAMRIQN